jgi:hypothetical protein
MQAVYQVIYENLLSIFTVPLDPKVYICHIIIGYEKICFFWIFDDFMPAGILSGW